MLPMPPVIVTVQSRVTKGDDETRADARRVLIVCEPPIGTTLNLMYWTFQEPEMFSFFIKHFDMVDRW